MDQQIYVVAVLKLKTERLEEAKKLLHSLALTTRDEPGCIEYRFVQDANDQSMILSTETWRSLNAFQQHMASSHFESAFEQLQPLLESKPNIHTCNAFV